MFRAINSLILASILFLVSVIAFIALESSPSDAEINTDIAALHDQIKLLESESDKYSSGAITDLIRFNVHILKTSVAMLEQKKLTILRRINMTYPTEGTDRQRVPTSESLVAVQGDIEQAKQKIASAEAEAAKYTGGLIQGLALITAQTERLSLSLLTLKLYSTKYGFGIPLPEVSTGAPLAPTAPPGKVVRDKEAL